MKTIDPVNNKSVSKKGLDILKQFEGLNLNLYYCPANKPTIGYGHVLTNDSLHDLEIEKRKKISLEEANQLLMQDVITCEDVIRKFVDTELNQNQFDALISLIFNIGKTNFLNSTLYKLIQKEHMQLAADEFTRWVFIKDKDGKNKKSQGLLNRREAEKKLFTTI